MLALQATGRQVTRAALLAAIKRTGSFDLGGLTLTYGSADNQGLDQVFLTVIQPDGSLRAVTRLDE